MLNTFTSSNGFISSCVRLFLNRCNKMRNYSLLATCTLAKPVLMCIILNLYRSFQCRSLIFAFGRVREGDQGCSKVWYNYLSISEKKKSFNELSFVCFFFNDM